MASELVKPATSGSILNVSTERFIAWACVSRCRDSCATRNVVVPELCTGVSEDIVSAASVVVPPGSGRVRAGKGSRSVVSD